MSTAHPLARLLGLLSASACLHASAAAQSVYATSWLFPDPHEITGPGVGPCAMPQSPVAGAPGTGFWSTSPPPCPSFPSFGPIGAFEGDIAADRIRDHVWITDGDVVVAYVTTFQTALPVGTVIGVLLPTASGLGTLTGLGFDAPSGLLWATDGQSAAAFAVVPPPTCAAPSPAPAIGPFALPPLSAGALYTDLDWDSSTSSLLLCASDGSITSVLASGAPGPFGTFQATSSACSLPLGPLLGIAVDAAAAPGSGTYYASDGFQLVRQVAPGVPAAPTFYSPQSCAFISVPLAPLIAPRGLAFSARALRFGPPSPDGLQPYISSIGQTTTPSPGFALRFPLVPSAGVVTVVGWSSSVACPHVPLFGEPLALGPPVSLFAVAAAPAGLVPAPIPPGLPVPGAVFFQGFVVDPAGPFVTASEGLAVSFALP